MIITMNAHAHSPVAQAAAAAAVAEGVSLAHFTACALADRLGMDRPPTPTSGRPATPKLPHFHAWLLQVHRNNLAFVGDVTPWLKLYEEGKTVQEAQAELRRLTAAQYEE